MDKIYGASIRQDGLQKVGRNRWDLFYGFGKDGLRVGDKVARVGLMNSTSITKAMGQPTTTLWFGESKMEVPCDTAIQLLSALEMYALECFNVTAAHKKAVSELTSIEEVEKYDITAGYPAQLRMEV